MNRREIVTVGVALGAGLAHGARSERMKPQIGDVLVHAFGDRAGSVISPTDVGRERIFAFALAPDGVVRDGSLHGQLSLLRVDEALMSAKTRPYAAGPILAVSAACTHTGCEVSGWQRDNNELICPCHGSRFAVLDAARVVLGPATKPLALLHIELGDGVIRVAGKFSRRVGPAPTY
ncbi:MAG: Rieske 2Fe-2S domain-containing protein [Gammaproteobacteria bacterium]|nr:Rieske 2Fe-2S domain-containing protein [Gammaproteobacteria bacterium]